MTRKFPLSTANVVGLGIVMVALYLCTFHDFLLFHSLTEIFSIVIAYGIFLIAWNSRHIQNNHYLLFLGIAYLFVGSFDLVHTLFYKGMMVHHDQDANIPTQLWIISRYTESISLLIAPLFLTRPLRPFLAITIYLAFSAAMLWTIFTGLFPTCFVDGVGLTAFKIYSEYIICAILVSALVVLWINRHRFNPGIFNLLGASIIMTIGAELAFTSYINVYDISNIIGHFLKFISCYLIYKALVETGLKEPYKLLFKDLKESEEKFLLMANSIRDVIWMSSADENELLYVNPAYEKIWGRSVDDLYARRRTFIDDIHPDDLATVQENHQQYRFNTWESAYRIIRPDGSIRWIKNSSTPIVNEGDVQVRVGIARDITDRKLAELEREDYLNQLNILMRELERSNSDLQQFANIISHDLQEPLRTVNSFVRLLARRYQGHIDEKADSYINFILDGTNQMQALLRDLLSFARLGGGQLRLQPLDLHSILDKVLQNLNAAISENRAQINIVDLPEVVADATQMTHLLQNLVANGIKFRREDDPVLEIGSERRNGEWIISIRDNGIGIDSKYAERIFILFQKLHRREDYEGTGMGLAICKKIIERHRGRIWVESEPGNGSSFYFSLPVHENE